MIETKKREIGGREWSVVQFSGSKNLDVAHAIFKVLGPALAQALVSGSGVKGLMESKIDIGGALDGLLKNLDSISQLRGFVDKLLQNTFVNGRPVAQEFDDVFAGFGILQLPEVIKFVIEANFGDFPEATADAPTTHPSVAAEVKG